MAEHNSDNDVACRIIIQNVGGGVQVGLIWPAGAFRPLAFISGTEVSRTTTTTVKRRIGGTVMATRPPKREQS